MVIQQIFQQLMLKQFTVAFAESLFNALIQRSPQTKQHLRLLDNQILKIQLKKFDHAIFLLFHQNGCHLLSQYEGETDCALEVELETLSLLKDKSKLSELINNKSLVMLGNIEVLQHFSALLNALEKNPAELLSPIFGDVIAQGISEIGASIITTLKKQSKTQSRYIVENLINERPVMVHRLQAVDFYDQIAKLQEEVNQLEQRINRLTIR
ncbi:MAG: SCP2 sterol-binding domain-containing protein [Lonepinella koalarum]|nr:SCP2 sterol-binding domain-containing protein [Lonepinella koalarum]